MLISAVLRLNDEIPGEGESYANGDLKGGLDFERSIFNIAIEGRGQSNNISFVLRRKDSSINTIAGPDPFRSTEPANSLLYLEKLRSPQFQAIELALWLDEGTREIFIVKNVFGLVPLYYTYIPNRYFIFSTSFIHLTRMEVLRRELQINLQWVSTYLSFEYGRNRRYSEETLFSNVKKILPAHRLSLGRDGSLRQERFFSFDISNWSSLNLLQDFGSAFLELFRSSVERCVGTSIGVTTHLSGGLDSSSISCVLRHTHPSLPIHGLFLNIPGIVNSEIGYAREVSETIDGDLHVLDPGLSDLDDLLNHTAITGLPEMKVSGSSITARLFERCQQLEMDVMLCGHDGDSIVGYGIEYPEILYDERRWDEMMSLLEARALTYSFRRIDEQWDTFSAKKKLRLFLENFLYEQLLRKRSTLGWTGIIGELNAIGGYFGLQVTLAIAKRISAALLRTVGHESDFQDGILNTEVGNFHLSENKPLALYETMKEGLTDADFIALKDVYGSATLTVPENVYPLFQHYGVVEKYPFLDKALFELCLATPLSVKFDNGRLRGVLREAMRGVLPESVRTRGDKSTFTVYGRDVVRRLLMQSEDFLVPGSKIWQYVDARKFELLRKQIALEKVSQKVMFYILRTISLAIWLDWNAKQPDDRVKALD